MGELTGRYRGLSAKLIIYYTLIRISLVTIAVRLLKD